MSRIIKALAGVALGALTAYLLPKRESPGIPVGQSRFLVPDDGGVNDDPIPVYCYRPATWREDGTVLIAFPGIGRGAERYRDHLIDDAVKNDILVACPDFTKEKFPHGQYYQNANLYAGDNTAPVLQPRRAWTFPSIDNVVKAVKARTPGAEVVLFGFSAGGQLISRFELLSKECHADRVVCASPGWFTFPDRALPCPYGIGGLDVSDRQLARAFGRRVMLLVGNRDISRKQPFPLDIHTDMQGTNRIERMNNYFRFSQWEAARLGVPFRWSMGLVGGAAHDEIKMTVGAMRKLKGEPLDYVGDD